MLFNRNLLEYVYLIPVILLSLSFHEFAHAYASYKLGDPTAKNMGRLTLNPLKHLDILGTIMLIVSRFGWAKPVPINPVYYKDRRKGTMLVSLAGPLSNVLLAFIFYIPAVYLQARYGIRSIRSFDLITSMFFISSLFVQINLNLAVFNILPVPPLDGSKILSGVLPPRQYFKFLEYENYVSIAFLILVFALPGVLSRIMSPFTWFLETAIRTIVNPLVNMLL